MEIHRDSVAVVGEGVSCSDPGYNNNNNNNNNIVKDNNDSNQINNNIYNNHYPSENQYQLPGTQIRTMISHQVPALPPIIIWSNYEQEGPFQFHFSNVVPEENEKICGVCGDKAIGYNFDACSCESCKAFFRRNAPKGINYFKCHYESNCQMDLTNRRFCKWCRLKKCLSIGMKTDYIHSIDKIQVHRKKEFENKRLLKLAKKQLLRTHRMIQKTSHLGAPLNKADTDEIDGLILAFCNSANMRIDDSQTVDLFSICEMSLRRDIALAKQLPAFQLLTQADQIILLKTSTIELLILRSIAARIKFCHHLQHPKRDSADGTDEELINNFREADQLKKVLMSTGLLEEQENFSRSLINGLKVDEVTLTIMMVVCLFSPDKHDLIRKEMIASYQEHYSSLLRRYLECRYPAIPRTFIFPKLLMKLTEIRNLHHHYVTVLTMVRPDDVTPLMRELLNIG